jgi:glycosyltransferase involved in cell wall biosynthesis
LVQEVRELGYDTTVLPTTHLSHLGNYLKTVLALSRWIKSKKLEVVLSWMPKAHLYVSVAALFNGAKVLWYQHNVPYANILDQLATLLPTHTVLCCSNCVKQSQDRLFPGRRTSVCYPGVELSSIEMTSQDKARMELNLPVGVPVVGMVARLERRKGAHVFLNAATAILDRYPEARLFVVGGEHPLDPAYAEELTAKVLALNRGKQIMMAGQRPSREIPLWQAAADVLVHPATGLEPFGMAVVEAMAQGKVVVASNMGGPSEVIQNEVSGILIKSGDSALLAATVVKLLEEPERRMLMQEQAYLRSRNFSIAIFVSRFHDLATGIFSTPV